MTCYSVVQSMSDEENIVEADSASDAANEVVHIEHGEDAVFTTASFQPQKGATFYHVYSSDVGAMYGGEDEPINVLIVREVQGT